MSHEPTQQARPYFNPYETTMQSDPYGVPIIPPPPPNEKHSKMWLILALVTVFILSAIIGTTFLGVRYYSQNEHKTTPIVTPTVIVEKTVIIETPTPVPPTPIVVRVPYMADEIVRDFVQANIYSMEGSADGSGIRPDYHWQCCTYKPEGGAYYWLDCGSCGSGGPVTTIDLATFASGYETQLDASQLENENFRTSVIGDCLLSYEQNTPDYSIINYVNVMQQYCY